MTGSFYAPPHLRQGSIICLPPQEAHHALHVRRLRPQEEVIVVDGEGSWFRAVLWERTRKHEARDEARRRGPGEPPRESPCRELGAPHLALAIVEERREVGEPLWRLTLAQAVGKGRKIELVVEKGTELGVSAFVPLATDRKVVRRGAASVMAHHERYRRIAVAAMKQCGRSRLPAVELPRSLTELRAQFHDFDAVLMASLPEKATTVEDGLRHAGVRAGAPSRILAIVGPEGGFTRDELRGAMEAGAIAVTLGSRQLRTETAGITMAVLVGAALDPHTTWVAPSG